MSTLGVGGTPNTDGWTYAGQVTSSAQSAVLDTVGTTNGGYEIQVATFDGEFWSPYSATAVVTVPATIHAGSAGGSGAITAPSTRASVDAPPAPAQGAVTAPLYSVKHILNTPSASATAASSVVEPIWTWDVETTSSTQYAAFKIPDDWSTADYQFEVRTNDGEFWSPWSDAASTRVIQAIRVSVASGAGSVGTHTIDAGARAPAAGASGQAVIPTFNISIRVNTPCAAGSADSVVPTFLVSQIIPAQAAVANADMAGRTRITPVRTNLSILDHNGVWQPALRAVLTHAGVWEDVGETQVLTNA